MDGVLVEALTWVDTTKTPNVDKWNSTDFWLDTLPHVETPAETFIGDLTNNAPIEVITWSVDGTIGETGLEWWEMGLSLLLRHI